MDKLYSVARNEIRLYKPLTEEETYPIYNCDISKVKRYKPGMLCDSKTHDLPDQRLLMAEYQNDDQSMERSDYFDGKATVADNVYQKIIYLNRAIDTDILNTERYMRVIEYYRELISLKCPFTEDLEKEMFDYKKYAFKMTDNVE
jgi:hypothetical protein